MCKKEIQRPKLEDYIMAEEQPEWLNTPSPFDELDNDWVEIIIFYVFHVPVADASARAKPLNSYGWGNYSNTNDFKVLKRRLIKYGNLDRNSFLCEDGWAKLKQSMISNNLFNKFPFDITKERVTFRKSKSGENDSLLSHIRNSFAHGRLAFYQKDNITYVVMEDIDVKKHVSARMILSKTTLMRWKTIIMSGPGKKDDEYDKIFRLGVTNEQTNF